MKPTKIIFLTLFLTTLTIIDFSCKKDLLKQVSITPGTFTDPRDGLTYKTTTIGPYTWLAENLDFATDSSFYYNNDTLNKVYGRLYTWNAAQSAIPAGWHLPTYYELDFLSKNLGGEEAAFQMKESGNLHWTGYAGGGNNYSGLTILPGGEYGQNSNQFQSLGSGAVFWEYRHSIWQVDLSYSYTNYIHGYYSYYYTAPSGSMFSIRCVKDY